MKTKTLQDAKDLARSLGFVAVMTAAGPVLLSKWFPYGRDNDDAFEFRIERDKLIDGPQNVLIGTVCGAWRLLNGVTMEECA